MTVDERRTVTRAVSPPDREAERAEVTSLLTRLVGCDSTGTNAFFLRADVEAPAVPSLDVEQAYRPHKNWLGRGCSEAEQFEIMQKMPYVEV